MWIRQVKESWAKVCVARMQSVSAAKEYSAACLANHSEFTSERNYGLHLDVVVQVKPKCRCVWLFCTILK
jgi:hypothetical protein